MSADSPSESSSIEDLLEAFERKWESSVYPPELARWWEKNQTLLCEADRPAALTELVSIDLEYRWKMRQKDTLPPTVEVYVHTFAGLVVSHQLLAEEYRVRLRFGDCPQRSEYRQRFPELYAELDPVLAQVEADVAVEGGLNSDPMLETSREDIDRSADTQAMGSSQSGSSLSSTPEKLGRYQVMAMLGQGSFGSVYLVRDPLLERLAAIKLLHRCDSPELAEAYLQEARRAARLQHSGVVRVYDYGVDADRPYIVMEYVAGTSLQRVLAQKRILAADEAAELILKICTALDAAHQMGMVHSDMKPANILMDSLGQPHIADFGLAISNEQPVEKAVCGTPRYMAPEQVRGERDRLNSQTDIWSLGVIFYEMLVGNCPFNADTIPELFDAIKSSEPLPPEPPLHGLAEEFLPIVKKCLKKNQAERPASAQRLAESVQRSLENWRIHGAQHSVSASQLSAFKPRQALTPPPHSLVGRSDVQSQLTALLGDSRVRQITVTGPAGIGKSDVVRHTLTAHKNASNSTVWIDAVSCGSKEELLVAVALALGSDQPDKTPTAESLAEIISLQGSRVVVLDHIEPIHTEAVAILSSWVQACPECTFVCICRQSTHIAGEKLVEVPPLPLTSESGNELPASAELFLERAKESSPNFAISDSNRLDILEICRRLEGIPLAIVLAAGRVRVLKPKQILQRLDETFAVLRSPRKDLNPRHQTLENAILWSLELLEEEERQTFLSACLFPGSFSLELAEQVLDPETDGFVLDHLQSLREKNLLLTKDQGDEIRFGMFQSVRAIGLPQALQTQDKADFLNRLAEVLLPLATQLAKEVVGSNGGAALGALETELPLIQACVEFAAESGQVDTAADLALAANSLLEVRGPLPLRIQLLELVANAGEKHNSDQSRLVDIDCALSQAHQTAGNLDTARKVAEQAAAYSQSAVATPEDLALCNLRHAEIQLATGESDAMFKSLNEAIRTGEAAGLKDVVLRAFVAKTLGHWRSGQLDETLLTADQAITLAKELSDTMRSAAAMRLQGHVYSRRGDFSQAKEVYAQAHEAVVKLGDRRQLQRSLASLGMVAAEQGQFDEAMQHYIQAYDVARRMGDLRGMAMSLTNRGLASMDQGDADAALGCFAEAEQLNRRAGNAFGVALNMGHRGGALLARGQTKESLRTLIEAESLLRDHVHMFQLACVLTEKADALSIMGRIDLALETLEEALSLFSAQGIEDSPEYFHAVASKALTTQLKFGDSTVAATAVASGLKLAEELQLTDEHPRLLIRELLERLRTES
jgi:serine/threonine protein kinase/tetratricopeptide (TPR) repeat protein